MPFYSYVSELGSYYKLEVDTLFIDEQNSYGAFSGFNAASGANYDIWGSGTVMGTPYYGPFGDSFLAYYPIIKFTGSNFTSRMLYTYHATSFPRVRSVYVEITCTRGFDVNGKVINYTGTASGWISTSGNSSLSIVNNDLIGVKVGGTVSFTRSTSSDYERLSISANMTAAHDFDGQLVMLIGKGSTTISKCSLMCCGGE